LYQAQLGLVFGVAWQRTKSLWLPVMLHVIHDVVEMAPVFLLLVLGFM
jgi:membrane protease YdiL (CAAX protease family)